MWFEYSDKKPLEANDDQTNWISSAKMPTNDVEVVITDGLKVQLVMNVVKFQIHTSAKFNRFACFLSSVTAYLSFIFRTRLPPRLFLVGSTGLGNGLTNFTGGSS